VVGVDGSPNGRAALDVAIGIAAAASARVVAVHAVGLLTHLRPGEPPVPSESCMDELRAVFEQEWCRPLTEAKIPFEARLEAGDPVGALMRVAGDPADIVVVGSRGHRGLEVALGSTAHQLVMSSTRPVLVVPLPAG
jgi:nucleotide-binding universal stress UspA family protein